MLVPPYCASADLHALPDGIVDCLVRYDDVAALAERGDDAGDGGEGLCVDDTRGYTKMCCDVRLGLHVYVLRAVEAGRATRADPICAEGLDGLLFECLVCDEVVVVVGCEIRDGAAVGEFRLGPCWSTPVSTSGLTCTCI